MSVRLVAESQVVREPPIHLHECLEDVVDQCHDCLIQVLLIYPEESREHDERVVLLYQGHDVDTKNLLHLPKKHHFLLGAILRPETKQPLYGQFCQ